MKYNKWWEKPDRDIQKEKEDKLNTEIEHFILKGDLKNAGYTLGKLLECAYNSQKKDTFQPTTLWSIRYFNEHIISEEMLSRTDKNVKRVLRMHDFQYAPHIMKQKEREAEKYHSPYFNDNQIAEIDEIFDEWVESNGFKRKEPKTFLNTLRKALEEYSV